MFKINYSILSDIPPKKHYSEMSIDSVYQYISYEAQLEIMYDGEILFSEEISIIEFYWYLLNWYKNDYMGNRNPFTYTTVENTEPILTFEFQQDNSWKIDSIWKRCKNPAIVFETDFHTEISNLIIKMSSNIENSVED